ncbi:non-homologous end-joining DNA ligase [Spongisporangium articulatum]|uniref:DNA ligase (ATP) n=1 Tax=Spongisporangium articulatum TaxID=3362603 RepID=A0ABW8AHD5_9ACTN
MLATPADPDQGLPDDPATWAYEVKWDGMRILADIHEGAVHLFSRTERDVTIAFPELAGLARAHPDLLLDGEVVVLAEGVPSFAALAERFSVRDARKAAALAARAPASLIVFDALRMYGVDLMPRPWQERRDTLERLDAGGAWQLSPVHDDLPALTAAAREHGLEGVVAKRRTSRYRPGTRSPDWLKLPFKHLQACLVAGWRPETGDRNRIGALLLAVPRDDGSLAFAGRVGSGLAAGAAQTALRDLLTPLAVEVHPFADDVPREDARGTHWVRPEVVVEVRYLGRTEDGRLRQPVYRGIRTDLDPGDLRIE